MEKRLSAAKIKTAPDGKHQDGGGLIFNKAGSAGRWVFRFMLHSKRREMGLGAWPAVSLADARIARDKARAQVKQGIDPIDARSKEQEAARFALERQDPTFEAAALVVFDGLKATLKGDGKLGRWLSPLRKHVFPRIGKKRLSKITPDDIADALRPIWKAKHPTARKALDRARIILNNSRMMGRECQHDAADRAVFILGAVDHKPQPIPHTPWQEIPALYARLDSGSLAHQCLRLMILTAVRGTPARGARQSELIDGVWTIPAERMKSRRGKEADFRVPISDAAQAIFDQQTLLGDDLLFPSMRSFISDARLSQVLTGMGEVGRPHGFRSSFRTWTQDVEACSWEVAETVLAHTVGGKVERSYARSDLLDRRRIVMDAWAGFVTGARSAGVVPITG